jgi:hypothetical protein
MKDAQAQRGSIGHVERPMERDLMQALSALFLWIVDILRLGPFPDTFIRSRKFKQQEALSYGNDSFAR